MVESPQNEEDHLFQEGLNLIQRLEDAKRITET
jgi:hypothetical protein